jgi:hypothetical protein
MHSYAVSLRPIDFVSRHVNFIEDGFRFQSLSPSFQQFPPSSTKDTSVHSPHHRSYITKTHSCLTYCPLPQIVLNLQSVTNSPTSKPKWFLHQQHIRFLIPLKDIKQVIPLLQSHSPHITCSSRISSRLERKSC